MKLFLDPTLHIVDTNVSFIITTKNINLKMNIGEAERKKTYQLIQKLRSGGEIEEYLSHPSQFECKLVKLLLSKGIISNSHLEINHIDWSTISTIYAPFEFLQEISNFIDVKHTIQDDDEDPCISIEHLRSSDSPGETLHIQVTRDYLYVSQEKRRIVHSHALQNSLYLKYAAIVMIEKLAKNELQCKLNEILKIDLSLYTNEITKIETNHINELNLMNSLLAEKQFGYQLSIDYERFFPLVYTSVKDTESNVERYAIGFDETDVSRNLLFILQEIDHVSFVNRNKEYHCNHKLNVDSFIKKFFAIYFSHELQITDDTEQKTYSTNQYSITMSNNSNMCLTSLFLTLLLNQITDVKGVYSNETKLKILQSAF